MTRSRGVIRAKTGAWFFAALLAMTLLSVSDAAPAFAEPASAPPRAIYDEKANPDQDIARAVAEISGADGRVLVVFGANWCPDCRAFDEAITRTGLDKRFRIVKVDVGRFDKHKDVAARFGVPLEQGIPTIAVLNGQGTAVFTTQAGELADARGLGDKGVVKFLDRTF